MHGRSASAVRKLEFLGALLRVQQVPLEGPPVALGETSSRPSLRLWLIGEHVDLHARCQEVLALDTVPFWAFCWAGGQALARLVTERRTWVTGKHVVDFGAGSGVAGIAAMRAGAAKVTCVDHDPAALEACLRNAELNGVHVNTSATLPAECDLILAADVLYDETGAGVLRTLRESGVPVLLADPGRPSSQELPWAPLVHYPLCTLPDVDPPMREVAVYAIEPDALNPRRRRGPDPQFP